MSRYPDLVDDGDSRGGIDLLPREQTPDQRWLSSFLDGLNSDCYNPQAKIKPILLDTNSVLNMFNAMGINLSHIQCHNIGDCFQYPDITSDGGAELHLFVFFLCPEFPDPAKHHLSQQGVMVLVENQRSSLPNGLVHAVYLGGSTGQDNIQRLSLIQIKDGCDVRLFEANEINDLFEQTRFNSKKSLEDELFHRRTFN